jgi:glycosyltransferase involved in cell wall biosynthesis
MKPRLHVLANPFGITHSRYRMEPFNQAVLKFINNMLIKGYDILHYGHESSSVPCENVVAVQNKEMPPPHESSLMPELPGIRQIWTDRVSEEIGKRKQPGDQVLCFYGRAHEHAVMNHQDLTIIEPSIGYGPAAVFAPYRAFTSYAQMHYFYGLHGKLLSPSWFDTVIPNAFTPDEFEYSADKDDYFVYLGRLNSDKGVNIAIQVTRELGKKLVIASPGPLSNLGYEKTPHHVEHIGYVDVEKRKKVLSRAQCLMAPTHYIEPFGNIVVEALMSGTPVITTDWGGFVDTVVNGFTGYRCKSYPDFVNAAKKIDQIKPLNCRQWAMDNFSDQVVHDKFDHWLTRLTHKNFYE